MLIFSRILLRDPKIVGEFFLYRNTNGDSQILKWCYFMTHAQLAGSLIHNCNPIPTISYLPYLLLMNPLRSSSWREICWRSSFIRAIWFLYETGIFMNLLQSTNKSLSFIIGILNVRGWYLLIAVCLMFSHLTKQHLLYKYKRLII